MPDPFVVGPTGLPQYRYPDWRASLVQRWRTAYGDAADTSPETPDGLVIDTETLGRSLLGDGIQSTYGNSFVRTAEGVSLDLILDLFGRQRLPATPTTVDAVWYGDAATVVWGGLGTGPVASVLTTGTSNGDRYELTEAGTIPSPDDDGAIVVFTLSAIDINDDIGIEFDAAEAVITAASDDVLEGVEALALEVESLVTGTTTWTGLDADGRAVLVIRGKGSEVVTVGGSTTNPGNVVIYGGIELAMEAEETGPQQVLAGTLLEIGTPAAGLEGIVNTADGEPGRDRETDADFRARHYDQINVGGRATPARIRAALLDQDPADRDALELEDVAVFNNPSGETATIDGRSIPAHSFEVVVLGDALDAEIAAVLFTQIPAGIESQGTTLVVVDTDESGGPQDVRFTRATERYLHLQIDVTTGEGFPSTGDPEGAIVAAVVADLPAVLLLGRNFYRERVRGIVSTLLPGIVTVTVTADDTAAPGDAPTLAGADITVAADEILRVDSSRITVNV